MGRLRIFKIFAEICWEILIFSEQILKLTPARYKTRDQKHLYA